MKEDELTFEKLPLAVAHLIKEVNELKLLIESDKKATPQERKPIGIDKASKLILKSRSTIYEYARKGLIPCYKTGRRLYFYEDELIAWINNGKRKTHAELLDEIHKEINYGKNRFSRR
ncbi:DNA-binding protein [Marinifilum breve]|uniref:DNA-binding protein n=2 Tax=Marinifilum breve TaxID=2184082 RepID=A0A2V4AEG9_9BACT|nr:DNA-binding protein [Marinifilum breve]